jgi:hypothetical protein
MRHASKDGPQALAGAGSNRRGASPVMTMVVSPRGSLLDEQPVERVGEYRFAIWDEIKLETLQLSTRPQFFVGLSLLVVGIALAARYCLQQISLGNVLPVRVFAIGLFVLTYGLPIVVVVATRLKGSRGRRAAEMPRRPPGVPSGALPARIAVRRGAKSTGASIGWLWFGDGFLFFQGDRFSCRLSRGAVKSRKILRDMRDQNGVRLLLPKGFSSTRLLFRLGFAKDGKWHSTDEWSSLATQIALWEQSSRQARESIFPPMRAGSRLPAMSGFLLQCLGLGVLVGGAIGLCLLMLPAPGLRERILQASIASGAMLAIVLPLSVAISVMERKSLDFEVEKMKKKLAGGSP